MSDPVECLRTMFRGGPTDKAAAEREVRRLYADLGEKAPRVVWAPSPLRLMLKLKDRRVRFWFWSCPFGARLDLFKRKIVIDPDLLAGQSFSTNVKMMMEEISSDYPIPSAMHSLVHDSLYQPTAYAMAGTGDHVEQVKLINASTPFWLPFKRICVMCERPWADASVDPRHRLQSRLGKPAVEYRDGWHFFADHGQRVPSLDLPTKIDYKQMNTILREGNPNHLKISFAIDIYGRENFVRRFCHKLDSNKFGEIYTTGFMAWNNIDRITFLRVENSTPDASGKKDVHFLRVPPSMYSARDAVAWTFNIDPSDYEKLLVGEA